MALKIVNKVGPMQQQNYLFSQSVKEIAIGRDASQCQVLYPADFVTIGRKHLVIVEDVGRYEVRVNKDNPVFINGKLAVDDQELPAECTINLGVKDGPAFNINTIQDDTLPDTVIYKEGVEVHEKVTTTKKLLAMALVLIVALSGYFGYSNWQFKRDLANTEQQMGDFIGEIYQEIEDDIGVKASQAINSVYLVLMKSVDGGESPIGTAWVVAPGKLATNAHVAVVFDDLEEGVQLIVRSPGDKQDVVVDSVSIHPGYDTFTEAWEIASPQVYSANGELSPMEFVPGYDVALLNVKATLAAPLKLATADTLENLKAGMEVAFVGYPMENLSQMDVKSPTPTIQVANITSIVDFFRGSGVEMAPQMIMHSLPATGGASGSPIINRKGEVVALLNAGNVVLVEDLFGNEVRLSHGADVNFAQRSDLLLPLLQPDLPFDLTAEQRLWQRGFERFVDKAQAAAMQLDYIQAAYVESWKESLSRSDDPSILSAAEFTVTSQTTFEGYPAVKYEYKAESDAIVAVNAISTIGADIDMFVAKVKGGRLALISKDTSSTFHPFAAFHVQKGEVFLIVVVDGSANEEYSSTGKIWFYQYLK
ncbi:trypsin-like peptidase domain-containing protein [Shewanella ulleungensis]|uniref:FHA domain-containing protein n=1 Tax=Shewanella ulleungensis TaxID=2282699 RepID=A0ABQ2QD07_9GAMM|nr:trypsin-like peptidase domain-containing protein [Shewanella ulleungensis]MCL1148884.1 trypsin-like peptidase domain-containing protein [Shewanella ulleungensis]GGP75017.1 hypothetical protein GCM10009410_03690 [Shewanella ulleungensis]